jgi:uracil-DNA glycosylase
MVRKVKDVPGCRGCPLYQTGEQGFVEDEVRPGSLVSVVGQNPGATEEQEGRPFVGETGKTMEDTYLPIAGLKRSDISIHNAIRCRWEGGNKLPDIQSKLGRGAVEFCTNAHFKRSPGTVLHVAMGGYALLALTGHGWAVRDKISEWRGWILPIRETLGGAATSPTEIYTPGRGDSPVMVVHHVAALGYDPSLRLPAKNDWQRIRRFLHGDWPAEPPLIRREIDEDLLDFEAAWDTEFIPERDELLRFSVATGEGKVYVIEHSPSLAETLGGLVRPLEALPGQLQRGLQLTLVSGVWYYSSANAQPILRIFMQNSDADLPYLARLLPEGTTIAVEDEMLAHSVLHGGFPHSLDYLSSLHSPINRHKHLAQANPVVYSGMDAYTQYIIWRVLEKELKNDPASENVYRTHVLPLVAIILEAEQAGILIDQAEVSRGVGYLEYEMEDSTRIAQAAAGYKINIGSSQQVGRQLYDVEDIKLPRGRG